MPPHPQAEGIEVREDGVWEVINRALSLALSWWRGDYDSSTG